MRVETFLLMSMCILGGNHCLHMLKKLLFSRIMSFAPARLDVDPSIIDSNLMMVNLPHFVKPGSELSLFCAINGLA